MSSNPPSLAEQLEPYVIPVTVAVLLWIVLFGQELFRGRISIRSWMVLIAIVAAAVALVGPPVIR